MVCNRLFQTLEVLDDERRRARRFLHSSSFDKVIDIVQQVMVENHKIPLHAITRDVVHGEKTKGRPFSYSVSGSYVFQSCPHSRRYEEHVRLTEADSPRTQRRREGIRGLCEETGSGRCPKSEGR